MSLERAPTGMFCAACGTAVPDDAQFCPGCGAAMATGSGAPPAPVPSAAPLSRLLSETTVSISANKLDEFAPFEFRDTLGGFLGEARSVGGLPPRFTLSDDRRQTILAVDAVRAQGLMFDWLVRDGEGKELAVLELKPGSWARERGVKTEALFQTFGITVGGRDAWVLSSSPTGSKLELFELGGGPSVASCVGKWGFRTWESRIDIAEGTRVDHRLVLGAFLAGAIMAKGRGASFSTSQRVDRLRP